MRKVSAKNKGFTLLELVISLALIAILIIPISNLVLGSVKINKAGEDKQQAGLKLQEVIENIKSVDLPKDTGEAGKVEVGNGVYVIKNEDKTFSISDSNDKDIKIEGTIEEVEDGEVEKGIGSKKVDGAIYYHGTSEKVGISSFAKEEKQIKDAVNEGGNSFINIEDSTLNIFMDKLGNIQVFNTDKKTDQFVGNTNNSIIICLDDKSKNKLNISVENEKDEKLTVYLYGKEGASKDDLILKEFKGKINMISTMGEKSLQVMKKYKVEIKAMKKGKQLESTSFTMIK